MADLEKTYHQEADSIRPDLLPERWNLNVQTRLGFGFAPEQTIIGILQQHDWRDVRFRFLVIAPDDPDRQFYMGVGDEPFYVSAKANRRTAIRAFSNRTITEAVQEIYGAEQDFKVQAVLEVSVARGA